MSKSKSIIQSAPNRNGLTRVFTLARQIPSGVTTTHVMALLGNQPYIPMLDDQQPDAIALQSLENLLQME